MEVKLRGRPAARALDLELGVPLTPAAFVVPTPATHAIVIQSTAGEGMCQADKLSQTL